MNHDYASSSGAWKRILELSDLFAGSPGTSVTKHSVEDGLGHRHRTGFPTETECRLSTPHSSETTSWSTRYVPQSSATSPSRTITQRPTDMGTWHGRVVPRNLPPSLTLEDLTEDLKK